MFLREVIKHFFFLNQCCVEVVRGHRENEWGVHSLVTLPRGALYPAVVTKTKAGAPHCKRKRGPRPGQRSVCLPREQQPIQGKPSQRRNQRGWEVLGRGVPRGRGHGTGSSKQPTSLHFQQALEMFQAELLEIPLRKTGLTNSHLKPVFCPSQITTQP